jgi:hypothetical protein
MFPDLLKTVTEQNNNEAPENRGFIIIHGGSSAKSGEQTVPRTRESSQQPSGYDCRSDASSFCCL